MEATNNTNETKSTPSGPTTNALHILMLFVSCLGVFTNALIVIVLSQLRGSHSLGGGERSARMNLLGLAIADFCICLSTLPLIFSKRSFEDFNFLLYYTIFGPGLVSCFLTVSAWMVVLLSLLRYLAVCWPIKSRFYLRCNSVVNVIICIYVVAFIFNLPYFLRYTYEEIELPSVNNGTPKIIAHIIDRNYAGSDLLKDIYSIAHIICTNVGPFISVLLSNISVIVACRRSEIIRLRLEHAQQEVVTDGKWTSRQRYRESSSHNHIVPMSTASRSKVVRCNSLRPRALHRVTPLLLTVIFAFLILSTPFGIVQFVCLKLISQIGSKLRNNKNLLPQYRSLSTTLDWTNFLQVFGCAVNFFLYFMVSTTFRKITKRTFSRILRRCGQRNGLSHFAACIFSGCFCKKAHSDKNEDYIVRIYSPVRFKTDTKKPFHLRQMCETPPPSANCEMQERNVFSIENTGVSENDPSKIDPVNV